MLAPKCFRVLPQIPQAASPTRLALLRMVVSSLRWLQCLCTVVGMWKELNSYCAEVWAT